MPITLPEILSHLDTLGLRAMVPKDQNVECGIRFGTESYVDPQGDRALLLICRLGDEGQYLEVFARGAYDSRSCRYKGAFFSALLHISFLTKHVQVEHDPSDGEVRLAADIPVADGTVTVEQLDALLMCLASVIEEFHPVLVHAMNTGKVDLSLRWSPKRAEGEERPAPAPELPPEVAELIARVGGLDNLESMLARHKESGGAS